MPSFPLPTPDSLKNLRGKRSVVALAWGLRGEHRPMNQEATVGCGQGTSGCPPPPNGEGREELGVAESRSPAPAPF